MQRRPWPLAIGAPVILLALAAPRSGMRLGFPDAGNDPPDSMTRQAYDLNTEGFGPGTNGPIRDRGEDARPRGGEVADRRARGHAAQRSATSRSSPGRGSTGQATPR